jgi:hypothetical protein
MCSLVCIYLIQQQSFSKENNNTGINTMKHLTKWNYLKNTNIYFFKILNMFFLAWMWPELTKKLVLGYLHAVEKRWKTRTFQAYMMVLHLPNYWTLETFFKYIPECSVSPNISANDKTNISLCKILLLRSCNELLHDK